MENWEGTHHFGDKICSTIADKGTYDIYISRQFNINGYGLTRIWSVRNEKRNKGTVSVNEHFKAWEEYGINPGKMYEVTFSVEGLPGNANVIKNKIIIE